MKVIDVQKIDAGVRADIELNNSFFSVIIRRNNKKFEINFINEREQISTLIVNDWRDPGVRKVKRKLKAINIELRDEEIEKLFSALISKGVSQLIESEEDRRQGGDEEEIDGEVKREAEELLSDPFILRKVKEILDKRIVGEDDVKLLLFLIALSKDVEPQSTLLVAESSTGKSYITHQIAELFTEDVLWFSRVTPAALDRLGRDLTGKILIIEEEAGINPEAEAIIRAWISEGKLRLLTTVKDETGNIKTEEIETTGKPVIISTTTKARIDEERATRIWILTPDTSKEQTRRILEFEAAIASGQVQDLGDHEVAVLREALRKLKDENNGKKINVLVPYAQKLASQFPADRTRARRDFRKILSLIKVSAYLHQRNRPIIEADNERIIIATLADLHIVWSLIRKSIKPTLTGLTPTHEEILQVARDYMERVELNDFTIYNILPFLNFSKSRLHDLIRELESFGYIEKVDGGPGKRNRYTILDSVEKKAEFTTIYGGNSQPFFSESELSDWLDRLFQFSTEYQKNIFEKFYSNIYDPLSDSEKENSNSCIENTDYSENVLTEIEGEDKLIGVDSEKIFSQDGVEKWKFETEEADISNSPTEENEFTAEIRGNSEESLTENKDNEAVSNITNGDKIKYVRIKMIKPVPFSKELIGADGKFYRLPEVDEEITLPEENAEPILRYGYAMKVGDGS